MTLNAAYTWATTFHWNSQYRFKRAIFGIRPIPALFSQMMAEVRRMC
jgi:hypothetical protein